MGHVVKHLFIGWSDLVERLLNRLRRRRRLFIPNFIEVFDVIGFIVIFHTRLVVTRLHRNNIITHFNQVFIGENNTIIRKKSWLERRNMGDPQHSPNG